MARFLYLFSAVLGTVKADKKTAAVTIEATYPKDRSWKGRERKREEELEEREIGSEDAPEQLWKRNHLQFES